MSFPGYLSSKTTKQRKTIRTESLTLLGVSVQQSKLELFLIWTTNDYDGSIPEPGARVLIWLPGFSYLPTRSPYRLSTHFEAQERIEDVFAQPRPIGLVRPVYKVL